MAVPVVTMAAAYLPQTPFITVSGVPLSGQILAIMLAAVLMGASLSGGLVGYKSSLLDICPQRKRTTFVGCYYLLFLPTAVVPIIAALIVGENNFIYAMILALAVGAISMIEVLRLEDYRIDDQRQSAEDAAK
jgi:MFS family permease